jgi:hypothetical protein
MDCESDRELHISHLLLLARRVVPLRLRRGVFIYPEKVSGATPAHEFSGNLTKFRQLAQIPTDLTKFQWI